MAAGVQLCFWLLCVACGGSSDRGSQQPGCTSLGLIGGMCPRGTGKIVVDAGACAVGPVGADPLSAETQGLEGQ